MAHVLFTPFPESAPPPVPPQDYQRIESSPEIFGGLIGQAEQRAGAEVRQTGEQFLNIYDQVASTDAYTKYQNGVNTLMYGDPNDPTKKGFLALTGADAMNALPQVNKQMNDLLTQIKGGLVTTTSQVDFERSSRRLQSYMMEQAGRHYDQAQKTWGLTTLQASMAGNERMAANNYNDEEGFKHLIEDQRGNAVKASQFTGDNPTLAIGKSDSNLIRSRIDGALAQQDFATASQIFDQYKDNIDPQERLRIENTIKGGNNRAIGMGMLNRAQGVQQPPPASSPSAGDQNWETQHNNFAGMRKVGVASAGPNAGGFQSFDTPEAGVAAIGNQLDRYASGATTGRPLTTLRGMINTWAPPSENDTPLLVRRAAEWTGFDPDQQIDIADPATREKVITAFIRNEQGGRLPVDPSIIHNVAFGQQMPAAAPQPIPTALPPSSAPTPTVVPPPGIDDLSNAQSELAQHHAATVQRLIDDPIGQKNPEALAHALSAEDTQFRAKDAALTLQKQVIVEQQSIAADSLVQRMMKGETGAGMVQAIADAPVGEQLRTRLWAVLDAHNKNTTEGDTAKYGPKFFDAFQRLTLPDGDPNRLRDPSQIIGMAVPKADGSQDLTIAGVDRLRAELQGIKAGPEGTGTTKMIDGMLAYGKNQIVFSHDFGQFGKLEDKNGETAFNTGFLPAFYKFYDAGIASGKSPQELLTKDNIDKVMAPFVRSSAQLAKDLADAQASVGALLGAGTQPTGGQDLTTQAGIIAAYKAGQLDRATAAQKLIDGGFAAPAEAPQPAVTAPIR